jgi:hypothetical protein
MRRIMMIGGVLLTLMGCTGVVGPRKRAEPPPWFVADPRLPIKDQKARSREYLALPEQSPTVAPRTYAEQPSYSNVLQH